MFFIYEFQSCNIECTDIKKIVLSAWDRPSKKNKCVLGDSVHETRKY